MKLLTLSEEIKSIEEYEQKKYLTLYKDVGYELGFGRRGQYKGHSHKFFHDILFSPKGFSFINNEGKYEIGKVMIVPQMTYMNDIDINDFFFVKFCTTDDYFDLPEKSEEKVYCGTIGCYDFEFNIEYPWYKKPNSKLSNLKISYFRKELHLYFNKKLILKA
jgi:hypothetical protein